jgi:hypothetical protein
MRQQAYLLRELSDLRSDLKDLKRCQLQYFSISITATGIILGFSGELDQSLKDLALLVPLTVILPCWLIFFDKATTITRIIGYQRIIEKQLIGIPYIYIGWENALSKFRIEEKLTWEEVKKEIPSKTLKSFLSMFIPWTRHRFWILNWYTFFFLSLIGCFGAIIVVGDSKPFNFPLYFFKPISCNEIWLPISALCFVIGCTAYTIYLLNLLIDGRLSYKGCTLIWENLLDPQKQGSLKKAYTTPNLFGKDQPMDVASSP